MKVAHSAAITKIYDHLCTLDQEVLFHVCPTDFLSDMCFKVEYVWNLPLTGGSVLFILNRYLPYIDTFMSLNREFISLRPEFSLIVT